jgi:hypothetical protein
MHIILALLFFFLCPYSICFWSKHPEPLPCVQTDSEQIVIFIHGTLPPILGPLIRAIEVPQGLHCTCQIPDTMVLRRIPHVLARSFICAGYDIPYADFYNYGWEGYLCFNTRENAGERLYQAIKDYTGEIILIGHSHGGNVALETIHAAEEAGNTQLKITLILLATPIQEKTKPYAQSPIIKRLFNIYSIGDRVQVSDPQGIYKQFRCSEEWCGPFFSERTLPMQDNLIQIRVRYHDRSPGHLEFMLPYFLKSLPALMDYVEEEIGFGNECVVNIPKCGHPYEVIHRRCGCLAKRRLVPVHET